MNYPRPSTLATGGLAPPTFAVSSLPSLAASMSATPITIGPGMISFQLCLLFSLLFICFPLPIETFKQNMILYKVGSNQSFLK